MPLETVTERAQKIIEENDAERIRNGRVAWFHDNITIVRLQRELLQQKLLAIPNSSQLLATEAFKLLSSGEFESQGKLDNKDYLIFLIDTARDRRQQRERQDNNPYS